MFPFRDWPWDYPTASAALGLSLGTVQPSPWTGSASQDLMKNADEFYNMVYGMKFTAEQLGID
jgi:hypothetical protein